MIDQATTSVVHRFPNSSNGWKERAFEQSRACRRAGRLNGMSYEWNGIRYQGSDLGRSLHRAWTRKTRVSRYDPQQDDPRLQELAIARARAPGEGDSTAHSIVRDRQRRIRASTTDSALAERGAMREVGRFRTVLAEDFVAHPVPRRPGPLEPRPEEVSAQNLLRNALDGDCNYTAKTIRRTREIAFGCSAHQEGKRSLRRFDRHRRVKLHQAVYSGFVKPQGNRP